MADEEKQKKRTTNLVNTMIDMCNAEARDGHPANVVTALQIVVAHVLAAYGIPPEMFVERLDKSMQDYAEIYRG